MSGSSLYDLSQIRSLPILDVCDALGIDVEKHGRNHWCKVRPERTASVILHSDTNFFHDFGTGRQGSVIDLVQYANSCTVGEAIRFLAKSFGIKPCLNKEELLTRPLSDREYRNIGLYGDMASKNVVFPIETATVDELLNISYSYRVPMNQLRLEAPPLYEKLILDKAVPYVEGLRNKYYRDVWNYYDFLCTFHKGFLFYSSDKTQEKFRERKAQLERAERTLEKAAHGTSIAFQSLQNYDPFHILSLIQQGRLAVSVGSLTASQLSEEAAFEGCLLRVSEVSYDDFFRLKLDLFRHHAIFNGKTVSLSYLETDHPAISAQIDVLAQPSKRPLSEQIAVAKKKECSQPSDTKASHRKEPVLS